MKTIRIPVYLWYFIFGCTENVRPDSRRIWVSEQSLSWLNLHTNEYSGQPSTWRVPWKKESLKNNFDRISSSNQGGSKLLHRRELFCVWKQPRQVQVHRQFLSTIKQKLRLREIWRTAWKARGYNKKNVEKALKWATFASKPEKVQ